MASTSEIGALRNEIIQTEIPDGVGTQTNLGAAVDGNPIAPAEPAVHDLAIITVSTNEAQWIRPCLRTVSAASPT
jgi:hypothetical protein